MAERPEGTVATTADGNLLVWRNGKWSPTTRQALDTGAIEAGLVGAGATFTNIAGTVSDFVGGGDAAAQARAEDERLLAPLEAERPFSVGAGRAAPFIAAGAATAGASLPGAIALEAGLGALEARPGERLEGAAFGGGGALLGGGLGIAARAVTRNAGRIGRRPAQVLGDVEEADAILEAPPRGARATAGAQQAANVAKAQRLGIELSPGEELGSTQLRGFEASQRSQLFGDPRLVGAQNRNQKRLNQIVTRGLGEPEAEVVTPDVLARSEARSSGVMTNAAAAVELVDVAQVKRAGAGLGKVVPDELKLIQNPATERLLANVERLPDEVTGEQFLAIRSMVSEEMAGASQRSETIYANALRDMRDALDDSLSVSARRRGLDDVVEQVERARQQIRLRLALERGSAVNLATGNVNGRTFSTALRGKFKREFGKGLSADIMPEIQDVFDAASVNQAFGDIVGDSGTATRSQFAAILENPTSAALRLPGMAVGIAVNQAAKLAAAAARKRGGGLGGLGGPRGPLPLDL